VKANPAILAYQLITKYAGAAKTVEIAFAHLFAMHSRHEGFPQTWQTQSVTIAFSLRIALTPSDLTFHTSELHDNTLLPKSSEGIIATGTSHQNILWHENSFKVSVRIAKITLHRPLLPCLDG
jgi:hypothetical protein